MFKYNVLSKEVNWLNPIDTLLKNRNIPNVDSFIKPNKNHEESLENFTQMEKGAKILQSMNADDVIGVLIDCDVDGYTSSAIMVQALQEYGFTNVNMIYHADKKHGLDTATLKAVNELNPKLLIIPDAGTTDLALILSLIKPPTDDFEELCCEDVFGGNSDEKVNDKTKYLILDHHDGNKIAYDVLTQKYSNQIAIINNQLEEKVSDKAMTGVGVVYEFVKYLDRETSFKSNADKFLDLVAVGMIADSCDLNNLSSRYLVMQGIELLKSEKGHNNFLREFVKHQAYSLNNDVTVLGIAFYITPYMNSIIRFGELDDFKAMFNTLINGSEMYKDKIRGKGEVELTASQYVVRLCDKYHRKQKSYIDDLVPQLQEKIIENNSDKSGIIMWNSDGIKPTVTGLVANKLASVFHKPVIFAKPIGNNLLGGSCRGYDKSEIRDFKQFLIDTKLVNSCEGHSNAFGVTFSLDNVVSLMRLFSTLPSSNSDTYEVDFEIEQKMLNKELSRKIGELNYLWGSHVEEPTFVIKNIKLIKNFVKYVGGGNTLNYYEQGVKFVMFRVADEIKQMLEEHTTFDFLVKFSPNYYNGTTSYQAMISDINVVE